MRHFLVQIVKYSLLIILLANLISFSANYFLKQSSFFKPSYIINEFQPGQKLDFIIAGSSRGLTSLDTKLLGSLMNQKGFNLSLDDTGLPSHLLMVQHFFESGFEAKNCILVIDQDHFVTSKIELNDNDYRIGPYAEREYIRNYLWLREKGILKPLSYIPYFPMLAYSYYNSELLVSSIISAIRPKYRHRFDEFGDYTYPNAIDEGVSEYYEGTVSKKVNITNPIIEDLAAYLKENNCNLILYIAPYKSEKIEISNQLNFPLINHSDLLKEASLFYDEIHVNLEGKIAATTVFAESYQILQK
ncbi:hypothetical protein FHS59_003425 [Algoriphagus iocasae]|jgi:hypothetical protein|uniref:Uncharacterized protein n=1 Tax=Algoriphagus iocasae TaxID=1836499 RepID=A0A841MHP2_9BACT|nr:hypothetical protein [Algoriphagus iocasae]MBB6327782.1 hypothetical protein [Algoriphagus iocasae]